VTKNVFSAEQLNLLRQSLKVVPLAQDVYDTKSTQAPPGWKIVANSSLTGQWNGGFFGRIYEKEGPLAPGETRYVVAFRGTDSIRDKQNRDADLQIIFRKLPTQHNHAVKFVKDFCDKNNLNAADMTFTGHSLGGYLAISAGITLGVHKMWAFNSPGPTREIRNTLSKNIPGISKTPCQGLVQIRSNYDVIARWQYPEGKIIEVETNGGNHSLANLRAGIEAAINGQKLEAVPIRRSIASFFNEVSKRLSQSAAGNRLLHKIFSRGRPRPPDCDCG
jgi:hypothetical protein